MAKNGVSLTDIYNVVNRLEDKMDKRMTELEDRVDVLENFRGWMMGVGAAISIFIGGFATWIWNRLTGD